LIDILMFKWIYFCDALKKTLKMVHIKKKKKKKKLKKKEVLKLSVRSLNF